jgi:hypothetical protein
MLFVGCNKAEQPSVVLLFLPNEDGTSFIVILMPEGKVISSQESLDVVKCSPGRTIQVRDAIKYRCPPAELLLDQLKAVSFQSGAIIDYSILQGDVASPD